MLISNLCYFCFLSLCFLINCHTGSGSGIRGKDASRSTCKSKKGVKCDTTLKEAPDAWASEPPLGTGSASPRRRLSTTQGEEEDEEERGIINMYDVDADIDYDEIGFDAEDDEDEEDANWYTEAYDQYTTDTEGGVEFQQPFQHRKLAAAETTKPSPKRKRKGPKKQGGVFDPLVMYYNQTHTAKNR